MFGRDLVFLRYSFNRDLVGFGDIVCRIKMTVRCIVEKYGGKRGDLMGNAKKYVSLRLENKVRYMKRFNITGTCFPDKHYMVDISERLAIIRKMIRYGDYFCINRGRQYGKTTTLKAIKREFSDEFCVFPISFEGLSDSTFAEEERLYSEFVHLLAEAIESISLASLDSEVIEFIKEFVASHNKMCTRQELVEFIKTICQRNSKPLVLLIDEVDQAGNYGSFLKFLGVLRKMYLDRDSLSTFQSVILAGVYDIKNLKLKIRPEEQHQYNSPWNIAAPFDVDMSLSAKGIAGMLAEYKADMRLDFDEVAVAQLIREYTSGYPFLVSRICMIIDAEGWSWDKEGVLKSVNALLVERNTLFDNMIKKLDEYPELKQMLKSILFSGISKSYNPDDRDIQMGMMFNYISNNNGKIAVGCRIMELRLYNWFISEEENSLIFKQAQIDKNQFIKDGEIDMAHLLSRFVEHMNQTYKMDRDNEFIENDGRKVFLTYLRPIINGVGNYHVEEQTRDHERMDVVVDYLGKQYVIELKIWRGNAYNERGEEQLCRYLEYFDLQTGYMLSFCFNKNKKSGLLPAVEIKGRTLIEAVV